MQSRRVARGTADSNDNPTIELKGARGGGGVGGGRHRGGGKGHVGGGEGRWGWIRKTIGNESGKLQNLKKMSD